LIALAGALSVMSAALITGQGRGQTAEQEQGRGGQGRGQAPAQNTNLPRNPTAVPLPAVSAEITGPGPMYQSVQSLAPGKGLAACNWSWIPTRSATGTFGLVRDRRTKFLPRWDPC